MGSVIDKLIQFDFNKNIIKPDLEAIWSLVGATYNSETNIYTLESDGYIQMDITNLNKIKARKFLALRLTPMELSGEQFQNYLPTSLSILITEDYITYDGKTLKRYRKVPLTQFINDNTDILVGNIALFSTLNRDMTSITVKIYNTNNYSIAISGNPELYASIEVTGDQVNSAIQRDGGIIQCRTDDPANPVPGQIWFRTDL